MRIEPVSKIVGYNSNKPLTINGCCDKINISTGKRTLQLGDHRFVATVVHCTSCGSVKATSNIKEKR
jgi:hypothetical protein